jgi:nucleotide-binding universal stress UspA family protein
MKTIVALVDFTYVTTEIVRLAETLAKAMRSRVVLLHVVPPEPVVATLGGEAPAIPQPPSPEEVELEKAKLQELLNTLTRAGVNASALQFEGSVVETVIEETEKLDADLIIMGSHHHNAFYNLFIGSVTADLLKRLPFPVLVVPADMLEKEKAPERRMVSTGEIRQNGAEMQPALPA